MTDALGKLPETRPRGRHPHKALSPSFVRSAPPGRHADGNGLYLYVQPSGARSWIQRLAIRGRRRELGLGSVALVSLAEAREQALANRKLARAGGDPLAAKRRAQGMPTFADAAARVLEQKRAGWRSAKHPHTWLRSLQRYAFPRIGARPVCEVTSADVLEILAPIWHAKPQTARNVRQRIGTVLEWAIAMELRTDNPCARILQVLGPQHDIVQRARTTPIVKLAFEFLVLTAVRWGEVRGAAWTEMDTTDHAWTIPAARMKMRRDHRVPLCGRALAVLDAARTLGGGRLVFSARDDKPLDDKRLRRLLRQLRIPAVPHGHRPSSFRWRPVSLRYAHKLLNNSQLLSASMA